MHGTPDPEHTGQNKLTNTCMEHQTLNTQTRVSSSTHAWNTRPWTHRPEWVHQHMHGTPDPEHTDQNNFINTSNCMHMKHQTLNTRGRTSLSTPVNCSMEQNWTSQSTTPAHRMCAATSPSTPSHHPGRLGNREGETNGAGSFLLCYFFLGGGEEGVCVCWGGGGGGRSFEVQSIFTNYRDFYFIFCILLLLIQHRYIIFSICVCVCSVSCLYISRQLTLYIYSVSCHNFLEHVTFILFLT